MFLSNEGMHERHWDILSMKIGLKVNPMTDRNFNFQKVLDLQLDTHMVLIEDVCNRASKEFNLMNDLQEMIKYWHDLKFDTVQSSNVDMILVKNFDEIIRISDTHLSTTANLMTSP